MQQAIKHLRSELTPIYEEAELSSVTRLIISKITGYSFTEILVNKNTIFSPYQWNLLEFYLEKLKKQMPVQYVLGETEFFGLDFIVNESVLIPRPETEELVGWIIEEVQPDAVMLDIGTESGCIPISLKSNLPNADVYACDISSEALKVARLNAAKNNQQVTFFKMDILTETKADKKYHVIVSNPPYIPQQEIDSILPQVKDFEPHQALFVDNEDPLIFYRKIASYAKQHLYPGGKVFFELHRDYANDCLQMLIELDFVNVVLRKDLSGNDRMIKAEEKNK
jgi:release factor glutamine methyltransferase